MREHHTSHRVVRSIAPALYQNNAATSDGAWVRVPDVGSIEACITFNNTADALAAALNWEAWVEKAQDDGSGTADGATALALTEEQYVGPSTELLTPRDGTGICFINAAGEDNVEIRVGVMPSAADYEWVRIRLRGNGNHAVGSIVFGWFDFTPQTLPVANP